MHPSLFIPGIIQAHHLKENILPISKNIMQQYFSKGNFAFGIHVANIFCSGHAIPQESITNLRLFYSDIAFVRNCSK